MESVCSMWYKCNQQCFNDNENVQIIILSNIQNKLSTFHSNLYAIIS